jgi:hypothetical protein
MLLPVSDSGHVFVFLFMYFSLLDVVLYRCVEPRLRGYILYHKKVMAGFNDYSNTFSIKNYPEIPLLIS